MATVTLLGTQAFDTNSGTKTVTATPAVNDLIVIVTAHTANTSTTAPTDNNADGLGTYTLAETAVKASSADTLKLWIRDARIGSATSTVFTHAPGTSSGGGLGVLKITGMFRAGSLAELKSGKQDNASAGTPAVPLGSAGLTGNPKIGAVFNATSVAGMTKPTTFDTERFDVGYSVPTTGLEVVSDDSGNTDSTVTWGSASASAFCAAVLELNATALPKTASLGPDSLSAWADVGTVAGASWLAALDTTTNIDVSAANVQKRLRMVIKNTGSAAGGTAFKWQYRKNGGTWTDITASSSNVKTFTSNHFADGDDVPQLLTADTYQSDNNAAEESTGTFTLTAGLATSTAFETEIALEFIKADVADADTLDFRIVTSAGVALDTYTQTPQATIVESAGATPKTFSGSDALVIADILAGQRRMRVALSDNWNA